MKVSDAAEVDTHAIVGGGTAQAFEIDDSPEFFTVLSDTMYRDKALAVVREIICNGWDIHVKTGKIDVPVEVTFTDGEMSIRDFGTGIPDDKIIPTYCRYGASTKVADETQTGGFGLGSKAPFSYSDHFTVTNCYGGFKTVYAMSKGGIETGGRPDVRVMVRVPTEETGITVSVPLKSDAAQANSSGERHKMEQLVREIAFRGAMNVSLNGDKLNVLDYAEARKSGFLYLPQNHAMMPNGDNFVYILYGTVLYPIDSSAIEIHQRVKTMRDLMCNKGVITLIAKPNTIVVTPAREALSFTEKTTATVIGLLENVTNKLRAAENIALKEIIKAHVEKSERHQLDVNCLKRYGFDDLQITADPVIAMRAVVHLGSHYGDRIYSDEVSFRRIFFRTCAKKFRDERRFWRRAFHRSEAELKKRHESHYYSPNDRLKCLKNPRYGNRLAMRLALKLNLTKHLTFGDFRPIRRQGSQSVRSIIVAPTREAARRKTERLRNLDYSGGVGYLILPKAAQTKLPKIRELSAAFKIKLEEASFDPIPRAAPKRKEAKLKFVDARSHYRRPNSESTGHVLSGDQLCWTEQPRYFLRVTRGNDQHFYFSGHLAEFHAKTPIFEDVAIAFLQDDEKALTKLGAKDVFAAGFDEFKALMKLREVRYWFALNSISMGGYHAVAKNLALRDFRIAKVLFPDRAKDTGKAQRAIRLYRWLKQMPLPDKMEKEFGALEKELLAEVRKEFHHFHDWPNDDKFQPLHLLGGLTKSADYDNDLLLQTVKFLQGRRHKSLVNDERKAA